MGVENPGEQEKWLAGVGIQQEIQGAEQGGEGGVFRVKVQTGFNGLPSRGRQPFATGQAVKALQQVADPHQAVLHGNPGIHTPILQDFRQHAHTVPDTEEGAGNPLVQIIQIHHAVIEGKGEGMVVGAVL